ncbi:sugar-binding transcriptional regulator [Paenibacillus sp. MER 180]|uniref:sugar-binding transcriptional regulator n=1 Tax=unclassified Paenibacillus TaxID=185978 RepID=UPI0008064B37|nr:MULTISPECIES: sugar-binding transcriptional regulator [unclassified Paenibacillus]MCM3289164.1 sugar-binding transcriptional regulator [Paenibacillus sp. MER 180]OBY76725.1 RNA polymerase subunit sigma-70 [Paenibacillus sp. KS1]
MDHDKQRLSIEAARLYYLSDYSQMDIAAKLGVSRPTVSRLLQYAKEQGFVRIDIVDPLEDLDALGARLRHRYGLDTALVCYSPVNEYKEIQKHISKRAAEYLAETVQDTDIIGVTWGRTMHAVAQQLQQKQVRGVEVVQLKGGISHSHVNTYAAETVNLFASAFHTIARYLPLPVIFDSVALKQMVEEDRHIRRIIQLGKQANIAVFTVGTVNDDALLFQLGYFSSEEKKLLQSRGVGDICSRFFDAEGRICSEGINDRTVGIDLPDLREKDKSILVAGGQRKIDAIRAALVGKYANILVTDQFTAQALLQ